MTWPEEATMSEGKQCLPRDVTEVDVSRSSGRTCLMLMCSVVVSMVKTRNEFQLSAYMMLVGNFATAVCCAEVLFQPSFFHVSRSVPRNRTLHRLSASSRDLLTPHLWTAVCISQAKECFTSSMY